MDKIAYSIAFVLLICHGNIFAQNPKTKFCLDSIYKLYGNDTEYEYLDFGDFKKKYFDTLKIDRKTKFWMQSVDTANIKCAVLRSYGQTILVLAAKPFPPPSGLAINFTVFMVIWPETEFSYFFSSLCNELRSISLSGDELEIIAFTYGDDFFRDRWDANAVYKISFMTVSKHSFTYIRDMKNCQCGDK